MSATNTPPSDSTFARSPAIKIGIVVILIVAFVGMLYAFLDVKTELVNKGYSKQAKRNNYLAAQLFLDSQEVKSEHTIQFSLLDRLLETKSVESANTEPDMVLDSELKSESLPEPEKNQLAAFDSLVLINSRGVIRGKRFTHLWQWVNNGGTLVATLENPFIGRLIEEDALFRELEISWFDASDEALGELSGFDINAEGLEVADDLFYEALGDADDQLEDSSADDKDFAEDNNVREGTLKKDALLEDNSQKENLKKGGAEENSKQEEGDEEEGKQEEDNEEENTATEINLKEIMSGEAEQDSCPENSDLALTLPGDNQSIQAYFNSGKTFVSDNAAWLAKDGERIIAALFEVGDGRVWVINDADLWHNRNIQCFDHAYMLHSMVNTSGRVWFLENLDAPSLFALLKQNLPSVLILAILTLFLGLWRALTRFGPVFRDRDIARRRFAEHLFASGVFAWKHQQWQSWVLDLRKDIEHKIQRRHPKWSKFNEGEKVQLILKSLELSSDLRSEEDVARALFKPLTDNKSDFVNLIVRLKDIQEKL